MLTIGGRCVYTSYLTSKYIDLIAIVLLLLCRNIASIQAKTKSEFEYKPDDGFPIGRDLFGQIVGIDVDKSNNVMIFHRGSHTWKPDTFKDDVYQEDRDKPIKEPTIVTIDFKQNRYYNSWGSDLFYMPHGLSIDPSGEHVWLTDVALHQVFKYTIDGSKKILELGTRFEPGNDENHFCKPTSVADSGDFVFVADGYCNNRIVMLTSHGKYIGQFGHAPSLSNRIVTREPTFDVPHKIIYNKEDKILCVADREGGAVKCFNFEPKTSINPNIDHDVDERGRLLNGAITARQTITNPEFNGRLFSIDYSPIGGGVLVAISGKSFADSEGQPVKGFVYNMTTGQLLSRFEPPADQAFDMAHDVAFSNDNISTIYVAEAIPVNLWKFSRIVKIPTNVIDTSNAKTIYDNNTSRASSIIQNNGSKYGSFTIYILISIGITILIFIRRQRNRSYKTDRNHRPLPPLYHNTYPNSLNSLFGVNRSSSTLGQHRFNRVMSATGRKMMAPAATLFSRRPFFNIFERRHQNNNEFSRIPFEDSDHSDEDHSDSDVEEFNINQASSSVNLNV